VKRTVVPASAAEERDVRARLARRTLELVDIASVSRNENAVLERLAEWMPPSWTVEDRGDASLFAVAPRRPGRALVGLAGHVDTVPPQGNIPGSIASDGAVIGLGAADMKGALAVMVEVARLLEAGEIASDLDVGVLCFGREEVARSESALLPLLERCSAARHIDLALVMEPTANALELGCLGNLNALVTFRGRSAHSARPWLGANAIHAAIRGLRELVDAGVEEVEIDGLVYREVVNVTTIEGGVAANVIPDAVACGVNLRYAPSRAPADAERRLRGLVEGADGAVAVISNAPPGPVAVNNPLVERLRRVAGVDVRAKQAWTPVAEFAAAGIDAVNFGPGDPALAHRPDERVDVDALQRSLDAVRAFLAPPRAVGPEADGLDDRATGALGAGGIA
jgi:succinyl-diaminopimelate desuccinylase